jgi:hypothetical protein
MGAPVAAGGAGVVGFLGEALASLRDGRLMVPALALAVLLTATNIVILLNRPVPGELPIAFAVAGLARVLGLFVLAVAILRILGGSGRKPFMPDGAFWLYGVTIVAGLALNVLLSRLIGSREDAATGAIIGILMIAVSAPFAAWFAAIAIERPLAASPLRWMRGMGRWLPALLLWSLVILLPLGQIHTAIDMFLLRGAGEWFWPLSLLDGPLSAALAILGFALAATAYRRVAPG